MDFSLRMTTKQAAAYLGRSTHWLSVNRERLGIPAYLIGGYYYFLKEDLDKWISEQQTTQKRSKGTRSALRSLPLSPITL
jgi:hypothetical protein